jgi:predicted PurR-regulated permease PerM
MRGKTQTASRPRPATAPPPPVRAPQPPGSQTSAQRIGGALLATVLVLAGLWVLHDFLAALAWAAVFAIAAWPLYRRLDALFPEPSRRIAAPLLLTLLIALLFVVPFSLVALAVAHEVQVLLPIVSQARQNGIPAPGWLATVPWAGEWLRNWWQAHLSDPYTADALLGRLDSQMLTDSARHIGGEIVHRLTLFVFTFLALFFLFRDGRSLARQLRNLSDRLLGDRGERIALQMIGAVHATLNGLVLVGLAEGFVIGIAYVAVHLPHAVSIAALTGVLAVIPFAAPVVFCSAAFFLLTQDQLVGAIVVLCVGFAVLFVADHVVRPVIIGGGARLPFLWVLLGILGGLESLGLLGLFVGPVVMAALMALWREETETAAPAGTETKRVPGAQARP